MSEHLEVFIYLGSSCTLQYRQGSSPPDTTIPPISFFLSRTFSFILFCTIFLFSFFYSLPSSLPPFYFIQLLPMAKMNLEFLLSPDKDNNNNGNNIGDARRARNDGSSSRPGASSPLSLDYIAPRTSTSSSHIPTSTSKQLSRRIGESVSTHLHPQQLPNIGPTSPNRLSTSKDQGSSSRAHFRGRKGRTPPSQSSLRNSSTSETKPHVCPSCERSFHKLEQLKRHDRLVHLNLRPFVCTTCDVSFGTKQNMQVHLTTRKHQHRLETLQRSQGSSSNQQS